jgi:hypothetical protein
MDRTDSLVILVNQQQLFEVDYLLKLSAVGAHVLFEPDRIRSAFAGIGAHDSLARERLEEVNHILADIVTLPTIQAKRDYLEGLPHEMHNLFVHAYFSLVDNTTYVKDRLLL